MLNMTFDVKRWEKKLSPVTLFSLWNWRLNGKLTENRFRMMHNNKNKAIILFSKCAHFPSSIQFWCHQFYSVNLEKQQQHQRRTNDLNGNTCWGRLENKQPILLLYYFCVPNWLYFFLRVIVKANWLKFYDSNDLIAQIKRCLLI